MPEEINWRDLAIRAKDELIEAKELIDKLTSPPFVYGTVISQNSESADIEIGGKLMEVNYNPDLTDKLKPGTAVRLNPETCSIIGVRKVMGIGPMAIVEEISGENAMIRVNGEQRLIKAIEGIKIGDRIIVDEGYRVVTENLGKQSNKHHIEEIPKVPWDKIGGLEKAIELIKESVEEPFVHREIYSKFKKRTPRGILLHGPPGCGKTLLAKGIAYNLAQRLKGAGTAEGNGYFLSIKGPELLNKYVGESERAIRELFQRARETSKTRGDVAVIFMDEAESLLKKRGSSISTDVYDSIVPQFLSEMDGMEENGNTVLVLATNREDIMDPAVLRPGRVDRKIKIGRPDQNASRDIFNIHLADMPVYQGESSNNTIESLAQYGSERMFSIDYPIFKAKFKEGGAHITLGQLTSGAMIESIAQRAAGYSIKRAIAGGKEGLIKEDIENAIKQEHREFLSIAQCESSDLQEIFPSKHNSIKEIRRCLAR